MNERFHHTLPDIAAAGLDSGPALERAREDPDNITTDAHDIRQDQAAQFPRSFILVA